MVEKTEFVLVANFGTPYGSGSQLIFSPTASIISFISLEFRLILLMTLGSQMGVSQIEVQIRVQNEGPK
jgi:hypothetical protein